MQVPLQQVRLLSIPAGRQKACQTALVDVTPCYVTIAGEEAERGSCVLLAVMLLSVLLVGHECAACAAIPPPA
jgi:hypothetical protein